MCVGVKTIYRASLGEVAAVRTERNLAQRLYPQRFARTEVASYGAGGILDRNPDARL